MEAGTLFNSGFLGSKFLWWVGQVMSDAVWRENQNECKFSGPEDVPGWGYRYKVRILGIHDQDEADIPNDQLPWAQIMYPVVAGSGTAGVFMTSGIRQGNFVFGFFLDGQDQQVPVIMGILGNNGKTEVPDLKQHIFAPSSGFAEAHDDPTKKVADNNLATEQKSPPIVNGIDCVMNQESIKDVKEQVNLLREHALACPNPLANTDMKGIQTAVKELSKDIAELQRSKSDFARAAGLPIVKYKKTIDQLIEGRAGEMSKYMGGIMGRVQQYTTDQYSTQLQQMLKLAPASSGLDLRVLEVAGLQGISDTFEGILGKIPSLLLSALKKAFKKKKNSSPPASPTAPQVDEGLPNTAEIPPLPEEDYYTPTPMCSTEEVVGEVLGSTLNEILQGFDDAISPPVVGAENASSAAGSSGGKKGAGKSPFAALAGLLQGGGLGGILGGLGALKGMNFDLNAAVGFIDNVGAVFPSKFTPQFSPNDAYTLASGGMEEAKSSMQSMVESAVNKKLSLDSLKDQIGGLAGSLGNVGDIAGNLQGLASGALPGNLQNLASGALPGNLQNLASGALPGNLQNLASGGLSDLASGGLSDLASGGLSNLASGGLSNVESLKGSLGDVSSLSGIAKDLPKFDVPSVSSLTSDGTTITTTTQGNVTTTTINREERISSLKGEKFSEDSLESIRSMRLEAVRRFNNAKTRSLRARMSNLINRYNEKLDLPRISVDDIYNFDYKVQE